MPFLLMAHLMEEAIGCKLYYKFQQVLFAILMLAMRSLNSALIPIFLDRC